MLGDDLMYLRMRNMHDGTSHYAMALVSYIAMKRATNLTHIEILKVLGITSQRFSCWSKACFGKTLSLVAEALLDNKPLTTIEGCPDEGAARAIAFIQGKKS